MAGHERVVQLRPLVTAAHIEVGEFSYYDDPDEPTAFQERNVLYAYGPERLIIGRFCAIAAGATFILPGANHRMTGVSTFPFAIFGGAWAERAGDLVAHPHSPGDTVVGNDVWIGYRATILPGARIGDGAIVAAHAVVAGEVPPYAIVAGNPARVVRRRFDEEDVARLLRLAWWDWPLERIVEHVRLIADGDAAALERAAAQDAGGAGT